MSADIFVDTNVLVYWRNTNQPAKQPRAAQWVDWLIKNRRGCLSNQVVQEFYVTVVHKLKPSLPKTQARQEARRLMQWRFIVFSDQMLQGAWKLEDRYSLSFWDALIISAAQMANCRYLLSEDMQDGLKIGQLEIISPFTHTPADLS